MERKTKKNIIVGLCKGRHDIPEVVENGDIWVFPEAIENPTDIEAMNAQVHKALDKPVGTKLDTGVVLYVTGLTVATVAVINWCVLNLVPLTLMHYDIKSGTYFPQVVVSDCHCDNLEEGGYL